MRRRDWAFVILFVGTLVLLGFMGCAARADDFADHLAALKAQNAARQGQVKGDVFAPKDAARQNCYCSEPGQCTCDPARCQCPVCAAKGPRVGDTMVTDDPARPWTYGYGREYGWDELGWYRPVAQRPRGVTISPSYGYYGTYSPGRVLARPGAFAGCAGGT